MSDSKKNSGDCNSGDRNSGHGNNGDRNSGHRNSSDWNSGHWNSGHWNSGHGNSGHRNSGDCNSGDCNSGHRNSGHFNSTEPVLRMFNVDTQMKISEYSLPSCLCNFVLTDWIPESNMTVQEKKDNPSFHVTEGYLKTFSYKEAWKNFWNFLSDAEKQQIKDIPNFDAVVFHEITGIDVAVNTDKMKQEMIKQAEELLKAGQELLNRAKGII